MIFEPDNPFIVSAVNARPADRTGQDGFYPLRLFEDTIVDWFYDAKSFEISGFIESQGLLDDPFFGAVEGAGGGVGGVLTGIGGGGGGGNGGIAVNLKTKRTYDWARWTGVKHIGVSTNASISIDFNDVRKQGRFYFPKTLMRVQVRNGKEFTTLSGALEAGQLDIQDGFAFMSLYTDEGLSDNAVVLTMKITERYSTIQMNPVTGKVGATVTFTGLDFGPVAQVSFGRIPAVFQRVAPDKIVANVPIGAITEAVVFTGPTPGDVFFTRQNFIVT